MGKRKPEEEFKEKSPFDKAVLKITLEVEKGANRRDVLKDAIGLCLLLQANVDFVFNGDRYLVSYDALFNVDGYKVPGGENDG